MKINLSKAYDSIEWHFIEDILDYFGSPIALAKLIMSCICTCTMKVLGDGHHAEKFSPFRGIRQGDPLSPYIFALCME